MKRPERIAQPTSFRPNPESLMPPMRFGAKASDRGATNIRTELSSLWVANAGSSTVSIVDTFDNSISGTITFVTPGQEWLRYGDFVHDTAK